MSNEKNQKILEKIGVMLEDQSLDAGIEIAMNLLASLVLATEDLKLEDVSRLEYRRICTKLEIGLNAALEYAADLKRSKEESEEEEESELQESFKNLKDLCELLKSSHPETAESLDKLFQMLKEIEKIAKK